MRVRIKDELAKGGWPTCRVKAAVDAEHNGVKGKFVAEGELSFEDVKKVGGYYPEIYIDLNEKTAIKVTLGSVRIWAELVTVGEEEK